MFTCQCTTYVLSDSLTDSILTLFQDTLLMSIEGSDFTSDYLMNQTK